ncbi:MAG: UvrD-helicase domain-containing protein [Rubrivivax sp.]
MNTPSLNPAQLEAVHHLSGPCLVLAGAGSGKTRVITHKIAKLLQTGLEPKQIAAITFTNKAAAEMRERARGLVGARAAKDLVISTFHSLGVRMLRSDGERIGLKAELQHPRQRRRARRAARLRRQHRQRTGAPLAVGHQSVEEPGPGCRCRRAAAKDDDERVAARVMRRYQERLAAYQAVDFDDLIGLPLALLQRDAEARAKWRAAFGHVLIDEYQDTNAVQYELLKALVGAASDANSDAGSRSGTISKPFTAVGDDDQSIYGWRGATVQNLKRLPEDFPGLKIIALEQNYRSTGHILRAANAVIAGNPKLFEKKLWSELGEGEPVKVIECDGDEHEAERVVARIQALRGGRVGIAGEGAAVKFADIAVLYRANHQAKVFEQKLRAAQIPYKVSGGTSYFDRAEIKDLCAWLRLIVNNDDDPAFLRAVTTPKRGIGHQTLATLGEFASRRKESLFEALFAPTLSAALKGKAIDALHEFGRTVNDLEYRARHASGAEDARAFLMGWLKDIGYEQHLHDGEDSEKLASARWTNVLDFVDWIARRCGGETAAEVAGTVEETERKSVFDVAQTISIIISIAERGEDSDVVTLSTLHAAKGLEWPHVVLAGVNEGLLPFKGAESKAPRRLPPPPEVSRGQSRIDSK